MRMYDMTINNKAVHIDLVLEANTPVFKSVCEGRRFYSCVAKKNGSFVLLVDKSIVGVGMWAEDQELLSRMAEDFDRLKGGN